jgi:cyanophycinase-like exopeptidase
MPKNTILLLFFVQMMASASAQGGYTKWVTGDPQDAVTTNFRGGTVLAGGGSDNDQAMAWMLQRAGGGDVLVLRASGSNGYNDYFFAELGVAVNSVETIRFDGPAAANDPYVIQQIRDAELVFFAGGNQYNYYQYWRNTPIEDALNYLLNEKGVTLGGTSAGMAILGQAYYAASGASLESEQGLANPFHANVQVLGANDFLSTPFLANLVTDTHYDQRDRQGRHVVFMARLAQELGVQTFGIACNEATAVCIDEQGNARVFGDYPAYDDFAYFLKSNCQEPFGPELMAEGQPLTWNRSGAAVKAYRLPGNATGSNLFDLNNWSTAFGGEWQNWYVEQGELLKTTATGSACGLVSPVRDAPLGALSVEVSPNPFDAVLRLQSEHPGPLGLRLFDCLGRPVWAGQGAAGETLDIPANLPTGAYQLEISGASGHVSRKKLLKN